jgi:hypothetical protein
VLVIVVAVDGRVEESPGRDETRSRRRLVLLA